MEKSIITSDDEMNTVGNNILETNAFFKDLVGIMQNAQFRNS
jgi:hypothetical protein